MLRGTENRIAALEAREASELPPAQGGANA